MNRRLAALSATVAAALLAGCAGLNSLRSDVATYGDWPASRKAGTYAIERLPSQQARADVQEQLEAAAKPALETAGFKPAETGQDPDVVVQLGARVTRTDLSPWDDPLWWRGGFGRWRPAPWFGPRWSAFGFHDFPRYEREVALLIRDRATGKPLYEARASSDGTSSGGTAVLRAMYAAALKDFPAIGPNPREVTVPLVP
jgi:Domain of unknown function (DUF4136)